MQIQKNISWNKWTIIYLHSNFFYKSPTSHSSIHTILKSDHPIKALFNHHWRNPSIQTFPEGSSNQPLGAPTDLSLKAPLHAQCPHGFLKSPIESYNLPITKSPLPFTLSPWVPQSDHWYFVVRFEQFAKEALVFKVYV